VLEHVVYSRTFQMCSYEDTASSDVSSLNYHLWARFSKRYIANIKVMQAVTSFIHSMADCNIDSIIAFNLNSIKIADIHYVN